MNASNNGKKKAGRNTQNKQKARRRRAAAATSQGFAGYSRGTGQGSVRDDIGLSLTRSQFTATTPLSLWEVRKASTPGGMRVRGREPLGSWVAQNAAVNFQILDVSIDSTVAGFQLNPFTFPRLASLGNIYEMYKFHFARVYWISNFPTTAKGQLLMSVDYEAADAAPANSSAMLSNVSSVIGNLYSDCALVVDGSLCRLPKYLCQIESGSGATATNQAIQATIFGACQGTETTAVGQTFGQVVVEYDVEFFTPAFNG